MPVNGTCTGDCFSSHVQSVSVIIAEMNMSYLIICLVNALLHRVRRVRRQFRNPVVVVENDPIRIRNHKKKSILSPVIISSSRCFLSNSPLHRRGCCVVFDPFVFSPSLCLSHSSFLHPSHFPTLAHDLLHCSLYVNRFRCGGAIHTRKQFSFIHCLYPSADRVTPLLSVCVRGGRQPLRS